MKKLLILIATLFVAAPVITHAATLQALKNTSVCECGCGSNCGSDSNNDNDASGSRDRRGDSE